MVLSLSCIYRVRHSPRQLPSIQTLILIIAQITNQYNQLTALNLKPSLAVTGRMIAEMAAMRSAACTTPAPVMSSPARMECVSHQCLYATDSQIVGTALMNWRGCARAPIPPVRLDNSCANLGNALTIPRFATSRGIARTTVMRRAVVRHDIIHAKDLTTYETQGLVVMTWMYSTDYKTV